MKDPMVDDVVRLTSDVPHLNLHKGDLGVVRSLWKGASIAYEVEFNQLGLDERTRAVLLREQVALDGVDEPQAPPAEVTVPEADGW